MASSGAADHWVTAGFDRELAETEMVRAAVVEFLRMEQSLRAAAAHLRAAEVIRAGADEAEVSEVAPALSELATRLALPG